MLAEEKKQINITGQNNRYQIKKLTTSKHITLRKNVEKIRDISHEIQKQNITELLNNILNGAENDAEKSPEIYISEIKNKISGYKQQDILKKRLNPDNFVSFNYVLEKLVESKLKCCYCSHSVYILYEIVREMNQWSLDRINNDIGHNKNNVVISCLKCNLKRRSQSKDTFMFSQNIKITRESYEEKETVTELGLGL